MATSKRKNPETRFPHGFIINGKLVDIGCSVHHVWAADRFECPDPRMTGSEADDAVWDGMRDRGWIRLTSDYSFDAFGGVDFLGKLTDKRLRLVQDVLAREGVVVEGVVVEDSDILVPFHVFMNARSIGELKNAMDSNRSPHLSEAWARKAARERGIEENPVKLVYIGSCPQFTGRLTAELIEMVHTAQQITRRTFLKYVDREEMANIEGQLGYDRHLSMSNDPRVGYYKSTFFGHAVVFFNWSAMEYLFGPQELADSIWSRR